MKTFGKLSLQLLRRPFIQILWSTWDVYSILYFFLKRLRSRAILKIIVHISLRGCKRIDLFPIDLIILSLFVLNSNITMNRAVFEILDTLLISLLRMCSRLLILVILWSIFTILLLYNVISLITLQIA